MTNQHDPDTSLYWDLSQCCLYVPILCLFQGTTGPDPCTVYVDMKSLRHDRQENLDTNNV